MNFSALPVARRGFSLIEVLVAVAVLSFGLLALASLQARLMQAGAAAKAQSVALNLAKQKLEELRSFSSITGYRNLTSSAAAEALNDASGNLGGVNFSRSWTVDRYAWPAAGGGFDNTVALTGALNPTTFAESNEFKTIAVTVGWTDANGVTQQVRLEDAVAGLDPVETSRSQSSRRGTPRGPEVIKNSNAEALSAVTLSEPDPTRIDTPLSCDATTLGAVAFTGNGSGALASNDVVRCQADYTVRASDASAGEVQNLSEVVATAPGPRQVLATGASTVVVPLVRLVLDKQIVSGNPYLSVGATIQYQYLVSNTGGASLPGPVTVSDDRTSVTCPAVSTVGDGDSRLDPGEQIVCTANYLTTVADVGNGSVTNTAQAAAGAALSNTDTATATFAGVPPQIGVAKAIRPITGTTAPFTVVFDIRIGNYGPLPLNLVQATEDLRQTFPQPVTFTVVSVQATGTAVANTAFNGTTQTGLLLPAQSTLAPGAFIDIVLTLQIDPFGANGPYFNRVVATGMSTTMVAVTDTSTSGVNADPSGDGIPDESTPTPVSFPSAPITVPTGDTSGLLLLIGLMLLIAGWSLTRRD